MKKLNLFHIFKIVNNEFVINDLSPRRTSITWTLHFAIPSLLEHFVSSKGPFFRPRNPLPNSSPCKTNHSHNNPKNNYVRIPTCSEFRTENCKKIFNHFPCSSEPLIMDQDYESSYCYLSFFYFIHNSRSFPTKELDQARLYSDNFLCQWCL